MHIDQAFAPVLVDPPRQPAACQLELVGLTPYLVPSVGRLMRRLKHRAVRPLIRRVLTPPALTIQLARVLTRLLLFVLAVLLRAVRPYATLHGGGIP
jgi:hypothetical protein